MLRQQLLERIPDAGTIGLRKKGRGDRQVGIGGNERRIEDRRLGRVRSSSAAVLRCRLSDTVPAAASEEIVPSNRNGTLVAARFDAPVTVAASRIV
jgi:hypothetical protein